ncbi:MAG: glycosyltransferase [Proteobacteria bacterium]|nr:glycosyltransferase [Pseudomonadota bacterium]
MKDPVVTVLITVFNGEHYLGKAIESVLSQTFSDFEVLVVNDGSIDSTSKILNSYKDERIRVISNKENTGPARSSNIGLRMAKGRYIARMDADDISLPERLEKQVRFLDSHEKIKLIGSAWYAIDENGLEQSVVMPPQGRHAVHFMCHGTIMAKRECIEAIGFYNEIFRYSLDYDFLLRFQEAYEIGILDEPLYKLRIHSQSISYVKRMEQELYAILAIRMAEKRKNSNAGIFGRLDPDQSSMLLNDTLNASWLKKRKMLSRLYCIWSEAAMSSDRNRAALWYTLQACGLNPFNRSVYALLVYLTAKTIRGRFIALFYGHFSWIRQIYWNSRAFHIDENWGASQNDYDILKDVITTFKPDRILDVGCGTGRLFPLFDSLNVKEVVGQEVSAKALRIANKRYTLKNIKTINTSLLDLDLPSKFFDLAVSNRVLQHVPKVEIDLYVKKLAELSKYIYINEMCESDAVEEFYYMFQHDYEKLFEKNGFFVLKKGMIDKQTWHLFALKNVKGLS